MILIIINHYGSFMYTHKMIFARLYSSQIVTPNRSNLNPVKRKSRQPIVFSPLLALKAQGTHIPLKLPWIFPGAPLNFNGAPGNIQGNPDRHVAWWPLLGLLSWYHLISHSCVVTTPHLKIGYPQMEFTRTRSSYRVQ